MPLILLCICFFGKNVSAKVNYTISPKTTKSYAKERYFSYVNKYNKDYLGFNACLEKMRKKGGGTLVVKNGTYRITNAICVPSNITIIFQKGAKFKKTTKTAKGQPKAAQSMWQIVPKKKSEKKNCVGKYNGSHNVKMIAKGKVTFDMNNVKGMCIVIAHAKKIEIKGITFTRPNGGHGIEISGSKNIKIHHSKFKKSNKKTRAKYYNKEAINIDAPDKKTHGLPLEWAKQDLTPSVNISIYRNKFSGTNRGVGTHKYSKKHGNSVYHKNIKITNNIFKNIYDNGIFVMSWKNTTIENNKFSNIGNKSEEYYSSGSHAITGGGVKGIKIQENTFTRIARCPIYFCVQQNTGPGSLYSSVRVKISDKQILMMANNKAKKCGSDISYMYGKYDALMFRGDSERNSRNAVGVKFGRKKIHRGSWEE